jgi:hypothetical protein
MVKENRKNLQYGSGITGVFAENTATWSPVETPATAAQKENSSAWKNGKIEYQCQYCQLWGHWCTSPKACLKARLPLKKQWKKKSNVFIVGTYVCAYESLEQEETRLLTFFCQRWTDFAYVSHPDVQMGLQHCFSMVGGLIVPPLVIFRYSINKPEPSTTHSCCFIDHFRYHSILG